MKTENTSQQEEIEIIMQMFGLRYSQAKRIYDQSGQNFNTAIQKFNERQNASRNQQKKKEVQRNVRKEEAKGGIARLSHIQFDNPKKIKESMMADQTKGEEQKKRIRQRAKENYCRKYLSNEDPKASKPLNYKKKVIDCQKQELVKHFIPAFQVYLGKPSQLAFYTEASEVFEQHLSSGKPIMLHLLNLSDMKQTDRDRGSPDDIQCDLIHIFLKQVYLNTKFISILNKQFINYGIDPKHFDFNSNHQMIEFFNPERDRFSLFILRFSQKETRVVVTAKMNIFEFIDPRDLQGFKKRVNDKKRDIARREAEDNHIDPVVVAERRKIEEDRNLRQMQEQEYMLMKQKYEGKQSEKNKDEVRKLAIKEIVEDTTKQREEIKKELVIYKAEQLKDPIQFKLRFPSGKHHLLHLPKNQKLEYIFTWIQCLQDSDLGFENNMLRSFDLLQPLSSLSLASRKDQPLCNIFTDSNGELLIVREN